MKKSLPIYHLKDGILMFALFASLILAGISNSIFAQNTGKVTGTITDASSGRALPGPMLLLLALKLALLQQRMVNILYLSNQENIH